MNNWECTCCDSMYAPDIEQCSECDYCPGCCCCSQCICGSCEHYVNGDPILTGFTAMKYCGFLIPIGASAGLGMPTNNPPLEPTIVAVAWLVPFMTGFMGFLFTSIFYLIGCIAIITDRVIRSTEELD